MGDETSENTSGFRFDPFDHELINDYLKPKIRGKQLPCNTVVKNREVYGPCSNPWQVFHPNDQSWLVSPHIKPTQKYMFVFTRLSRLSSRDASKNTSRRAGCGTWVGRASRKKIKDGEGNVIGESMYLVFEINEIGCAAVGVGFDLSDVGFYTMHEYSLSGINDALNSYDRVVVCKITYDSSKRCTLALKSAAKIADCDSGDDSRTLSSKNRSAIDSGVGDDLEESGNLTSESLVVRNSDVGDWYAAPQYDNGLQELSVFGGGFSLDDLGAEDFCFNDLGGSDFTDWIAACLDSNQEEEAVESNSLGKPGKRKFEANENSCRTKKICLW